VLRYFLLTLSLLVPVNSLAAAYEHASEDDGTITFSDKHQPGATKVDTPKPSHYRPSLRPKRFRPAPVLIPIKLIDHDQHTYTHFSLAYPTHQQTFQNQRHIEVEVAIDPKLKKGDLVKLFVDGKFYTQATTNVLSLNNLDRGEHHIHVELVNTDGRVIFATAPITIYIHYATRLLP